eukprot:1159148-Pelagomonas_calceolata.AAC.13
MLAAAADSVSEQRHAHAGSIAPHKLVSNLLKPKGRNSNVGNPLKQGRSPNVNNVATHSNQGNEFQCIRQGKKNNKEAHGWKQASLRGKCSDQMEFQAM